MARRIGLALGVRAGPGPLARRRRRRVRADRRRQAADHAQLERALAGPDSTVEVSGLEGTVPFDMRLARGSRWRTPRAPGSRSTDLRLAWSPRALLRGRLGSRRSAPRRIRLAAAAAGGPPHEPAEAVPPARAAGAGCRRSCSSSSRSSASSSARRCSASPRASRSRAISPPPTTAAARRWRSSAERHRPGRPRSASVDARLELEPPALELAVQRRGDRRPAGGADRPRTRRASFTLRLDGAGPLDGWTGDLEVDAEGLASAEAAPRPRARRRSRRSASTARCSPRPALVPDELAALVGERLGLALTARQTAAADAADRAVCRRRPRPLELTGDGDARFRAAAVPARTPKLTLADLAPLGGLIGAPLAGALRPTSRPQGGLLQPSGDFELRGQPARARRHRRRKPRDQRSTSRRSSR